MILPPPVQSVSSPCINPIAGEVPNVWIVEQQAPMNLTSEVPTALNREVEVRAM